MLYKVGIDGRYPFAIKWNKDTKLLKGLHVGVYKGYILG